MESPRDLVGLLVGLPLFALALLSRRLPRVTGALLLAATIAACVLFRLDRALDAGHSAFFVAVTFALPLLWCGVALLVDSGRDDREVDSTAA